MAKSPGERWKQLTDRCAVDDGLPCREVGAWSFDKLFWWNRYIEIATTAMCDKPVWKGVIYVDLFSGPGILVSRKSGERLPGSPLIACNAPKPFRKMLFCERDPELADALRTRLAAVASEHRFRVFTGDCNERIDDIVGEIPDGALTLAFIDPTGLHAHFETIRRLAVDRRADLFILLADNMDIVRNLETYARQEDSKLDLAFGPDSNWRKKWQGLGNADPVHTSRLFVDLYKDQLARLLGYEYSDDLTLENSQQRSIYRVVFAAKSSVALDFWGKAAAKERLTNRLF